METCPSQSLSGVTSKIMTVKMTRTIYAESATNSGFRSLLSIPLPASPQRTTHMLMASPASPPVNAPRFHNPAPAVTANCTAPITTPITTAGTNNRFTPLQPSAACATIGPVSTQANPRYSAAPGASVAASNPVADSSALNDEPSEPKVTAQPCPMDGIRTAFSGVKPSPIKIGAVTATSTV